MNWHGRNISQGFSLRCASRLQRGCEVSSRKNCTKDAIKLNHKQNHPAHRKGWSWNNYRLNYAKHGNKITEQPRRTVDFIRSFTLGLMCLTSRPFLWLISTIFASLKFWMKVPQLLHKRVQLSKTCSYHKQQRSNQHRCICCKMASVQQLNTKCIQVSVIQRTK